MYVLLKLTFFFTLFKASTLRSGPSASSLLTTKLMMFRRGESPFPPVRRDCLRNVTPANASLYRASYYKLWWNGRERNDNTKKRLLEGLPQRRDATGRDPEKVHRENESRTIRRIIRTRQIIRRTAYGLLYNLIKFHHDFRRYGIISIASYTRNCVYA